MDNASSQPTPKAVLAREQAKSDFLIKRVEVDSDLAATNLIGRSPGAVKRWDREDADFALLHQAAQEAAIGRREMAVEQALNPVDLSNLPVQLDEAAVDAMERLREIVRIKITASTKAADMAQIRLASEKLLEAYGLLKPREVGGTQVNVIVGQYAEEGRVFDPPWKHRKVIDVKGSVT